MNCRTCRVRSLCFLETEPNSLECVETLTRYSGEKEKDCDERGVSPVVYFNRRNEQEDKNGKSCIDEH